MDGDDLPSAGYSDVPPSAGDNDDAVFGDLALDADSAKRWRRQRACGDGEVRHRFSAWGYSCGPVDVP